VLVRPLAVLTVCVLTCAFGTPAASADPETEVASADAPAPEAAPADDGRVESSPPKTTNSPDGWTLTVSARDETQRVIAPLTTAISTREYEVGGIYSGVLIGPEEGDEGARGTLEVGYQIGCGIDMSTSNGVSLTGTVGLNPTVGVVGSDIISPLPEGFVPGFGNNRRRRHNRRSQARAHQHRPGVEERVQGRQALDHGRRIPYQDRRLRG